MEKSIPAIAVKPLKKSGPLTDTKIRNARPGPKPRKLSDMHGLYLEVFPNGSKLWRYRYRVAGKETILALGAYPAVTLSQARAGHVVARATVKLGLNPVHAKRAAKARHVAEGANTFEAVTREWIGLNKPQWSARYAAQVDDVLSYAVFPFIGPIPIKHVTPHDLLAVIKRVAEVGVDRGVNAKRKPHPSAVTALNVRQWCSAVFKHAMATLRADTDPTIALAGAVKRPDVQHSKALPESEIRPFLTKATQHGYRTTQIALRLMMMLFTRTVELRKGEWTEFDLDAAEWRIGAEKMKAGESHIVPLPRQAVVLLRELHTLTGGQRWLFPNMRKPKECMSPTTINRAIENMGYGGKFSGHGFRATASTILNERQYRPDVIERQLAHAPRDKVRASYNQAQYLPERRAMLQDYADLIDSLEAGGNVAVGSSSNAVA